ncbi:hypothetical protein E2562_018137 [Oryza meyeriana var. granulata]|uniref:Uncharacterized protein n=1 Tax=Oryza meyeriana var. granulata TaxID=110450 RepID=A0A6G1C8T7_9ORYZ|nr:hypothetical protein E2562_018137 [Oryza meyeriana var. granulata]
MRRAGKWPHLFTSRRASGVPPTSAGAWVPCRRHTCLAGATALERQLWTEEPCCMRYISACGSRRERKEEKRQRRGEESQPGSDPSKSATGELLSAGELLRAMPSSSSMSSDPRKVGRDDELAASSGAAAKLHFRSALPPSSKRSRRKESRSGEFDGVAADGDDNGDGELAEIRAKEEAATARDGLAGGILAAGGADSVDGEHKGGRKDGCIDGC